MCPLAIIRVQWRKQRLSVALVAKDDLTWAAGRCLTTNSRGNLFNFTAGFQECIDVFRQIDAIVQRRVLLGFGRHSYAFSYRVKCCSIHEDTQYRKRLHLG